MSLDQTAGGVWSGGVSQCEPFLRSAYTGVLTLTHSQVSEAKTAESDGCIAAFQSDTDKTSQRQSDRAISVMYLCVCLCVCVSIWRGGGGVKGGARGVRPCCDLWFGSIVWPSELTDGKPEPDSDIEFLPCPAADRQRTQADDPHHPLRYLSAGEGRPVTAQNSGWFRPAEVQRSDFEIYVEQPRAKALG